MLYGFLCIQQYMCLLSESQDTCWGEWITKRKGNITEEKEEESRRDERKKNYKRERRRKKKKEEKKEEKRTKEKRREKKNLWAFFALAHLLIVAFPQGCEEEYMCRLIPSFRESKPVEELRVKMDGLKAVGCANWAVIGVERGEIEMLRVRDVAEDLQVCWSTCRMRWYVSHASIFLHCSSALLISDTVSLECPSTLFKFSSSPQPRLSFPAYNFSLHEDSYRRKNSLISLRKNRSKPRRANTSAWQSLTSRPPNPTRWVETQAINSSKIWADIVGRKKWRCPQPQLWLSMTLNWKELLWYL